MKIIVFDTETTGLPKSREPALSGPNNWPHLVSIAWIVIQNDEIIKKEYHIIKPHAWVIPPDSTAIHGISHAEASETGENLTDILGAFLAEKYDVLVAHNMNFDFNVLMNAMIWDSNYTAPYFGRRFCTMEASRNLCRIPFPSGGGWRYPKLSELYEFVLKRPPLITNLHNSMYDASLLAEIIIKSTTIRPMLGLPATRVY